MLLRTRAYIFIFSYFDPAHRVFLISWIFQLIQAIYKFIAYFLGSWVVSAKLDTKFCNASIDFDVPGKPDPPPVTLTATFWTESHYMPTGTVKKNAIEFTDPSGTIGPRSVPLNTWVQLDKFATEQNPSGAPKNCLEGSPLVFKDEHDGDSKLVTLSGNQLAITSFQSSDWWSTLILFFVFFSMLSAFVAVLYFEFWKTNVCSSDHSFWVSSLSAQMQVECVVWRNFLSFFHI